MLKFRCGTLEFHSCYSLASYIVCLKRKHNFIYNLFVIFLYTTVRKVYYSVCGLFVIWV